MLLVTQSKYKINQLGFDKKTSEYVYIHRGVEMWREKGTPELLDYFATRNYIDEDELIKFPIYKKYSDSCEENV